MSRITPSQHGYGLLDVCNGAFTLDVKSMLNVDLGGILGGTQC
jgi:hypothetical protein